MIITCPHCQTRYQVAFETIGSAGRKVQCAHCGEAWQAAPDLPRPRPQPVQPDGEYADDRLFDEADEARLDAEFSAQERLASEANRDPAAEEAREIFAEFSEVAEMPVAAPRPAVDPALARKQQRAFFHRQIVRGRHLPLARVRRTARGAAAALLVLIIGGGLFFRVNIVQQFPSLAGLYETVGLGVNVVGLEIRDLKTMRSQRAGSDLLSIEARIHSVANRRVVVPPVVVSLFDEKGSPLYEWSVTPRARDMDPGEVVDLATELPKPPVGAAQVKLTFASGRGQNQAVATAANDSNSETH